MSPLAYVVAALGLLLALSVAGNSLLFNRLQSVTEDKGKAEAAIAGWKATADTCTASVDKLAGKSQRQLDNINNTLKAELPRIKGLQHDALSALNAKPADPNDLCKSIQLYLGDQIRKERAAK